MSIVELSQEHDKSMTYEMATMLNNLNGALKRKVIDGR